MELRLFLGELGRLINRAVRFMVGTKAKNVGVT
jgi:hypothetical protein